MLPERDRLPSHEPSDQNIRGKPEKPDNRDRMATDPGAKASAGDQAIRSARLPQ
jgi:hypothetical protein